MAKPARSPQTQPSPWERFVETGSLEAGTVKAEVADAWARCRDAGVDPYAGRSGTVLLEPHLSENLERHRELIRIARPFMENLYAFVASSSFVVLLCDERGYILETVGDPEVIRNAPDLNFCRGALWNEEEIGNNGVGTSLLLGRPFQVSGTEHYCRKHHPWTCSGAPIRDEQDRLIGILEMSGPVEATHQHTLGMVVAASEAIRQQLRVELRNRELTLLNSHLSNLFLTVSDGVVVVDAKGLIQQVNPVAEKLLGRRSEALVGQPIGRFLDRPHALRELLHHGQAISDLELGTTSGLACLASAKPIKDDRGHLTSGVLFLNPIQRINRLINRFSGAHATFTFEDILGQGKAIEKAIHLGRMAALSESSVMLYGESGTGKEMFAQAIHNQGARRNMPFIAINCGAIPRELIGSELFGYVEGAFTGAAKGGRPGKFELASGGTIFLDEIGDMPLEQQVSLLRVLQDKAITRIGGDKVVPVDVRIICATHKHLPTEIGRGNFRQDLYYRLNVISIQLPPLREHREDIPAMFKVFHERTCQRLGVTQVQATAAVLEGLQRYDWPGNTREFQNVVERLVNACHGTRIDVDCLPEEILRPARPEHAMWSPGELRASIKAARALQEHDTIVDAMVRQGGNLSEAARSLGISRMSLYRKLKKIQT